jgi:hypothetical protein
MSVLALSIAALISVVMFTSWPPKRNQPPLCRIVEIAYLNDDWRILKEIVIFDDSKYVLRFFSLAPNAERRAFAGRLPRDISSRLVESISTNACWAKGDLTFCTLRSISTNACWETTDGGPMYVYCANNTKERNPEVICEIGQILWSRHMNPNRWPNRFIRRVEEILGLTVKNA